MQLFRFLGHLLISFFPLFMPELSTGGFKYNAIYNKMQSTLCTDLLQGALSRLCKLL